MPKKAKIQFDVEKLFAEPIPQNVGNEGDDPQVKHLKHLAEHDPDKAQLFFEQIHKINSKKQGFEWVDRVRKADPPKPK